MQCSTSHPNHSTLAASYHNCDVDPGEEKEGHMLELKSLFEANSAKTSQPYQLSVFISADWQKREGL